MDHRWNVKKYILKKMKKSSKVGIYLPELANLELVAENIWYGSAKAKQQQQKIIVKNLHYYTLQIVEKVTPLRINNVMVNE